jgi:hypothetical protein
MKKEKKKGKPKRGVCLSCGCTDTAKNMSDTVAEFILRL